MFARVCREYKLRSYFFEYVEQILQSVQRQVSAKQNPTSKVDVGSVPAVAFGSRAHLEKHALATVS